MLSPGSVTPVRLFRLIPGADGSVVGVSYSQFTGDKVYSARYKERCGVYTHTVYPLTLV